MNNLTIINRNGKFTVDSREVADMVEKNHAHLLRDIQGYVAIMATNPILDSLDFFIPDTYQDAKGETRPCYLITKKGCDMVANKMTGEKGVLFTAAYVTKFDEMERRLNLPRTFAEALRAYADQVEQNELMKPKAEMHDLFLSASNNQAMNDVAKSLGIGRNKLFAQLRDRNIFRTNNTPYQRFIDQGYFVVKEKPITMGEQTINKPQTFATAKGVDWLGRTLIERRQLAQ